MISATSTWSKGPCSPSITRLVQGVLPMSPAQQQPSAPDERITLHHLAYLGAWHPRSSIAPRTGAVSPQNEEATLQSIRRQRQGKAACRSCAGLRIELLR